MNARIEGSSPPRVARVAPAPADLEVISLAAGGDGVARLHGLAVFIPRTAPGDTVRALLRNHGRFARGTLQLVLVASEDRVDALCAHFTRDNCGGCQWQHLSLPAQRSAKAQLVSDAFERIAHRSIAMPEVIGDDAVFGYRRTISLTVRGNGAKRVGGFHAVHDPDLIVPITQCLIAHTDVQEAWGILRRNLARLPVVRATETVTRPGDRRHRRNASVRRVDGREASSDVVRGAARDDLRLSVRRLDSGDIALVVQGGVRWHGDDVAALASRVPTCSAVWWEPAGRDLRLVWDRDAGGAEQATSEAQHDEKRDAQRDEHAEAHRDDALAIATSFVQVNESVADLLHAHVKSVVLRESPASVVDAYAGTGRLAIALAAQGVSVTAIEFDERAVAFAAARLPQRSRALAGTVESLISDVLPADVVVLNPPRSGVASAVTEALSAQLRGNEAPRLLVYVSCDPATLARDVARLEGWRVESVTCFDMFPQTAHVETVCLLRPEEM